MPYRKQQFENGSICHVILRGIDDNLIFKDTDDYYRGIFSIYEFNNTKSVEIIKRRQEIQRIKELQKGAQKGGPSSSRGGRASPELSLILDERDKFVNILVFCFMPNHLHLLLEQIKDNGITKFMSKVGTGYGGYFNQKYKRKGYVFQNRFLAVEIKNNEQLETVFNYIHTNPVSLLDPSWKESGATNVKDSISFLENYKWSSFQDYIGKKNFPSVTERNFLLNVFGGEERCKKSVNEWVEFKNKEQSKFFNDLFLEEN